MTRDAFSPLGRRRSTIQHTSLLLQETQGRGLMAFHQIRKSILAPSLSLLFSSSSFFAIFFVSNVTSLTVHLKRSDQIQLRPFPLHISPTVVLNKYMYILPTRFQNRKKYFPLRWDAYYSKVLFFLDTQKLCLNKTFTGLRISQTKLYKNPFLILNFF